MRKEDSLRPPRFATWLLEQLSPVLQNAPLAGDLLEAFRQGRSAGWYRRQVFVAILLALPNFFWKQFGGLVYAGCCTGVIAVSWRFFWSLHMVPSHLSAFFEKGYGMRWPWSFVYFIALDTALHTAFQSVMVSAALSVYLFFRSLTPRNLVRALPVVIVVLASANAVWTSVSLILLVSELRVTWWEPFSMVTLVALLLGMWKSNSGGTLRRISA